MIIRAVATTAIVMVILAMIGLFSAPDSQPETLNTIFLFSFYPAVLMGIIAYFGGSHAKNNR